MKYTTKETGKDRWKTDGAVWANENIERELAKVEEEGQLLANRLLRNKILLLVVVSAALFTCMLYLEPFTALGVELVILLIVTRYLKKSARNSQSPLYKRCDPYLQFAYIRAFARKPLPKTKRVITGQILSMAQCMAMAGEPKAAMDIQGTIEDPEKLRVAEKVIYYNTLLNCYGQYGWTTKRNALGMELQRKRAEAGKMEGLQMDVVLRLEELKRREDAGDMEFVLDYFKKNPAVFRFQEVAKCYALAMMYIKAGDAQSARENVEYVLKHGNKLYYKSKLEEYLRDSLAD